MQSYASLRAVHGGRFDFMHVRETLELLYYIL
jgi:hypothetical protein